ncbi:aminotransferase class III-fold pyridoxal phosphate-dependent enzyme [Verrucomicrobium spinosum]|uniref:aminotransferase class III-fold pyridoxal phosphate-dependent enzyme n=1 Tax=Verrucomicrobium spinosum TaxID=2736 RepID=UPI000AC392CE|nr:aminotransferase class III-fold pyridoxal phosphate-dependent enzyme [Verrucomicrobium spinosum]
MLCSGEGCYLVDQHGNRYLDGNASIWTNIHGHCHPRINEAIKAQLDRVAHTSYLGFGNPPAAQLASELVGFFPDGGLEKVFFSDNGSTAIEAAVRMSLQFWRQNGQPGRDVILAFDSAYHGDTLGAASLGGIPLFKGSANQFGYVVQRVRTFEDLAALPADDVQHIAAVIIEPLVQGVNTMRLWPKGMLKALETWCRGQGIFLILDEVMTGFGRTGTMFACQQEKVVPDFLCMAKGLSGGYLPLAATLVNQRVYEGFLGAPSEGRTFFYGHSFTGNQLGCAAALASLGIFREEKVLEQLPAKMKVFERLLQGLTGLPHVAEIRRCGLIAGIELVKQRSPRLDYDAVEQVGTVCAWLPANMGC